MKKNMSSFSMYTLILLSRGKRRARARKSNVSLSLSLSFMYNFRSLMFSVQRVSKQIREVYKWYVEQFPCTKQKEKRNESNERMFDQVRNESIISFSFPAKIFLMMIIIEQQTIDRSLTSFNLSKRTRARFVCEFPVSLSLSFFFQFV